MPDGGTSPTPTIRGVVVLGILDWVRREHGEPGVATLLERLPQELRHRYEGPRPKIVGTTPIPGSEMALVAAAIIDVWGMAAYHAAAAHVAISDLNGYMKLFLKIGTPTFVLRRLPRVLAHYCSEGQLSIDEVGGGSALICIRDVTGYGQAITEGAVGWIRAALELSGALDVEFQAQHRPEHSHYTVRWR